jgi:hypothetical protein
MKVFVGTAEEYKQVAHLFGEPLSNSAVVPKAEIAAPSDSSQKTESVEEAEITLGLLERALTRIPLSAQQSAVLSAVVKASPGSINTKELAKATGMTRQQIAGVWGALGRRFANTQGWPRGRWPIVDRWDAGKLLWTYEATPILCDLAQQGRIKLK